MSTASLYYNILLDVSTGGPERLEGTSELLSQLLTVCT